MKNNWKPFDITKALAGDPVISNTGAPVTEITRFSCAPNTVYGVVGGYLCNWDIYERDGSLTTFLYMAPKICTGYAVLCKNAEGSFDYIKSPLIRTKQRAEEVCCFDQIVGTLTWEE